VFWGLLIGSGGAPLALDRTHASWFVACTFFAVADPGGRRAVARHRLGRGDLAAGDARPARLGRLGVAGVARPLARGADLGRRGGRLCLPLDARAPRGLVTGRLFRPVYFPVTIRTLEAFEAKMKIDSRFDG